jgi:hypothetical protein
MAIDRAEATSLMAAAASDPTGAASRTAVCVETAEGLAFLGQVLWGCGYVIGPDRAAGESPYAFGSDGLVGLAAVAQAAGQLGRGAIALFQADNRYAASALMRQLVELEYLACAFANDDDAATAWLRADGEERRSFWTPAKVRARASDQFLPSDYWHHCDLGGHLTPRGMVMLLPGHKGVEPALLLGDLAAHLVQIWGYVCRAGETLTPGGMLTEWMRPETERAIKTWQETDRLRHAMQGISELLRQERVGDQP